jgi:hypothetical protein
VLGLLVAVGRGTARWLARVGAPARLAFEALASRSTLPGAGRRLAARVLLNALCFTALEALGLMVLRSGILSYLTIPATITQHTNVGAWVAWSSSWTGSPRGGCWCWGPR